MSATAPNQTWWTSRELAEAQLPDMPASRQNVESMAKRLDWRAAEGFARRRQGRGGGWEYHWKLLPVAAQKKLLADASMEAHPAGRAPVSDRDGAWAWFEGLPEAVKQKAEDRLKALKDVEALVGAGHRKSAAVGDVARLIGVSEASIWNWYRAVEGVRADDWLAYLAPRHRGARRNVTRTECSEKFWDHVKSDYLRLEAPSFSSCYRRALVVAQREGWKVVPEATARRRLKQEVSPVTQVLARKGLEAMKRLYPAQTRDKTALHALEAVNADFHKWDVFVRFPRYEGDNEGEVIRPQMVAFQDIYSGRILSWRVDRTPNKTAVALALGDMIEEFGIPEHMLLDNGREFANKFLTGQAQTRHRFKIKDDDIPGILLTLGCQIHWATPYSGQSKPIERAFRDLCDAVAKDPRLAGAYTGNKPDAKPENYGSKAIELSDFLAVVADGIEEHNARQGRRSETAMGRSFIETFDASYASAPIRKATDEQRRLWLMGAEGLKADAKTGEIRFQKNRYWSAWMHEIAGDRVVARFDPEDFRKGLHVYALNGSYLGHAEAIEMTGFFDVEEARMHAKARKDWQRKEREALEAHRKMRVTDISGHMNRASGAHKTATSVVAKIVKPLFKPAAKPAQKTKDSPGLEAAKAALVADLGARKNTSPNPKDDARGRFRRALDIEARIKGRKTVSRDDERWLARYKTQPEYRSQLRLYEDFGDEMFG